MSDRPMEARAKVLVVSLMVLTQASSAQWGWTKTDTVDATCFVADTTALFAGATTGVYRSTDKGKTWLQCDTGITNKRVLSIAKVGGSLFVGTNGAGVFRSSDHGATWSATNAGLEPRAYYVNSLCPTESLLFAGTQGGTFRTSDYGANWVPVDTNFTNHYVLSLTAAGNVVVAGTSGGGIRASTDFGLTWTRTDTVSPFDRWGVCSLAFISGMLFAGTSYGTFRSSDYGTYWMASDTAGWYDLVYAFAATPGAIFSGAFFGGVHLSTDSGDTWEPVNVGLTSTFIKSLIVYADTLFACIYQNGIWRRPLSEVLSVEPAGTSVPSAYSLVQNYPNPFNPSTTIRYALPHRSQATLTVFNTVGQKVAILVDGEVEAGYHDVQFNASGLASGVYFYRLRTRNFVETKAALLIK